MVSCEGLGNGGVQSVMMSIVRNLHDEFSFDALLFTSEKRYYDEEFLSYGGKIIRIPNYEGKSRIRKRLDYYIRGYSLYKNAKKLFHKNNQYQIVHCNNYFECGPILKAAAECGIPVRVAHCHNVATKGENRHIFRNVLNTFYKKMIKKNASFLLACSQAAGKYLFDDANFKIINNAIDLTKFDAKRFPYYKGKLQFVHVGRYCFQKNQLFLLDVFKYILKYYPNAELKLIGFGVDEIEVQNKIQRENLQNNVEMLPQDSDVPLILSNSFATIYPSTYEGLGISLIEAQAMGLRCYVSEAIQPEADLGSCVHLNLIWGPQKWADIICNDIKKNGIRRYFVDLSSYDIATVSEFYRSIYNSKN